MKQHPVVLAKPKVKRSKSAVARNALQASFEAVLNAPTEPQPDVDWKMLFILPLSPLSANTRMHWRAVDALKKQYKAHFEELRVRGKLPPVPAQPWETATVRAIFHTKAQNDLDNLIGRAKLSLDLIVRGGWLEDDNPKCLTWEAIPHQMVSGKNPCYVAIWLTRGTVE